MIIFILITIFAIYYIAMIASLFKSEGFSIIGLILDVVIMGTLIFYYFIGARFVDNDLSNFLMFMDTGSYIFMYFAIKCLWVKPKVVNYLIAKELGESKEVIEEQELDLQTSKIRGIYFFIISVVMLIITKLRMQPELQAECYIDESCIYFCWCYNHFNLASTGYISQEKIRHILIQDDSAISCYDLDYYSYNYTFVNDFY